VAAISFVNLQCPGFDYVCIGEGEQAMLELVEAIDRNDIPPEGILNIRAKGGPMPRLRAPFEPIDDLPFMARDMLNEKYGVVNMVTQRGCPFSCSYCAARQFSDLYEGGYANYGRRRSPGNVMQEVSKLRADDELNYIIFLDDTFTINHAWVQSFCRLYGDSYRLPFSIHGRAETVNEALIRHLAEAGCRHIVFGVESGSERVRREILGRKVSNEKLRKAFQLTREAGMLATANYMLGIPGETKEDIEQTLSLHDELHPEDFGYFVFYPYPGTPLFQICKERGYLPENYYDHPANHRASILTLPDLTSEDIEYYYNKFTQLRVRDRLQKLPKGADSTSRQTVIDQVEECAVHG
jgi:anaerobic magnesium-protoporphyrin IX monomethyl ester cyclase